MTSHYGLQQSVRQELIYSKANKLDEVPTPDLLDSPHVARPYVKRIEPFSLASHDHFLTVGSEMSSDNGKTFQMEAVNQMVRLTIYLERGRRREKDGEERREGGRGIFIKVRNLMT